MSQLIKISDDKLYAKTECYSMATEVKRRRRRWLGNVPRMEQKRFRKKGLRLNLPSKRKQGRSKITLRKTFDGDYKKMELTWGTAKREKQRIELHGETGVTALSSMRRGKQRIIMPTLTFLVNLIE